MDRRKSFDAPANVVVNTAPISDEDGGLVIRLSDAYIGNRTINYGNWLNKGIDAWVWACTGQLKAFKLGQRVRSSTIHSYGAFGIPHFYKFLTEADVPILPCDTDIGTIERFVEWMKQRPDVGYSAGKTMYQKVKAVLSGLQSRGVIPPDRQIFPRNPFPGSNARSQGAMPFSTTERARFAEALRLDIVAIHQGCFEGRTSESLVVFALAIMLRTGINLTPLLELRRDSLKPHPFMPNMMLLEYYKRRGERMNINGLRETYREVESTTIPMDGVAIFNKVLERTKELGAGAPSEQRDYLWLYSDVTNFGNRGVTRLSVNTFQSGVRSIVDRHGLLGDDGNRLRVTASRLRKTMENRLWLLSNGDLFSVATIMGHTPKVADVHYLVCTDEMRKNATFVGEALPGIYRGNDSDSEHDKADVKLINKLGNTPVGCCKDSLYGDKAPQDGIRHCSNFFLCFTCTSYAIVGTPKDLHRLFSFYWFLDSERWRSGNRRWMDSFSETMNLIDGFTLDKFNPVIVSEAKASARVNPIKFWKDYEFQERVS